MTEDTVRRGPMSTSITRPVEAYLQLLREGKKRGRRRTRERVEAELAGARADGGQSDDPLLRLRAIQAVIDLEAELATMQADQNEVEDAFVEVAKTYGERKRISYKAWRAVGVPVPVLKRAGITR